MTAATAQTRIDRPELTERLATALDTGSIVVLADAGFGKTTAVEDAVRLRGGAVVWVRTTRADRDPGRLLARLVGGLRAEVPGIAEQYADRIAGALDPLDAITVAQDLVEEMQRLLVEQLVVVFDDAEGLAGSASVGIIDELLIAGGDLIHVAICSRRSLRLRLAKLRTSGRLLELGSSDLAFSPGECAACLLAVRGHDPTTAEVERLFELTEGWPLGVALAAAADAGDGPVPASREAIFDYLAEEVLDGLDAELRESLESAAIVDELDPAIEKALRLPGSFRDDLVAAGIFVRAHEDNAYSIHPLLRDFLRARLAQTRDADQLGELHMRAAGALAASGKPVDAIDHWLAAGAFDQAAQMIAAHGVPLAGTSPETVSGWLDRLPAALRELPVLSLLAGRLAMGAGDFDTAVERCQGAVEALEREGAHEAMVWAARFALTDALLATIDLEGAARASAGAELAGPEAGTGAIFCALSHAAVMAGLGRHADSERALNVALNMERGEELLGASVPAFRGYYRDLPAGRLDDALAGLNAGIAALEAADAFNRLPYLHAFKMAVHEARGELDHALVTFEKLLEAARRTGLAGYIGAGSRLAAATMLAQLGRVEEARVQLELVDPRWSSWVSCDADLARAVIAARAGDGSGVVFHGRRALSEADRMPPFHRIRVTSVLAPLLCDAGRPELARDALGSLLGALRSGESTARTRTALACIHHRLGNLDSAHADLADAFAEAGEGARFMVRSEWPQVEPVLWSALEAGALEIDTVMTALEGAFPGGAQVASLFDHPRPEVSEAALVAAASSGRPDAIARLWGAHDRGREALQELVMQRAPSLAVRTLGGFEIRRGSWLIDAAAWERRVAERVVRLLMVRAGTQVPEDELLEAFWPDKAPASARRGLQTAISSARSAMDVPWEPSRIVAGERSYALALGAHDRLDARDFEDAATRALGKAGPERIVVARGRSENVDRRATPRRALLRLGGVVARTPELDSRRCARSPGR